MNIEELFTSDEPLRQNSPFLPMRVGKKNITVKMGKKKEDTSSSMYEVAQLQ
jgi:hypothetical protein